MILAADTQAAGWILVAAAYFIQLFGWIAGILLLIPCWYLRRSRSAIAGCTLLFCGIVGMLLLGTSIMMKLALWNPGAKASQSVREEVRRAEEVDR